MTPTVQHDSADALREAADATARLRGIPFMAAIGMRADRVEPGAAWSSVPFSPAAAEAPGSDIFCDGIVAAAADQAGSLSIWAAHGLALPHATVSLSLSFPGVVRGGAMRLESRLVTVRGGLAHTLVTVLDAEGEIAAHGTVDFAMGSYPGRPACGGPPPPPLGLPRTDRLEGPDSIAALGLAPAPAGAIFAFAPPLTGSVAPQALHGGVIAAAAAIAARQRLAPGSTARLAQLTVNYLRAGLPQDTEVQTEIVARSGRTMLVEANLFQPGDRHVAAASARFFG